MATTGGYGSTAESNVIMNTSSQQTTKSRFGDIFSSKERSSSNGVNDKIWNFDDTAKNIRVAAVPAPSKTLQGSSALEPSFDPDNGWPIAWPNKGQPSFSQAVSGKASSLRQRTAQNTRSSSPYRVQAQSNAFGIPVASSTSGPSSSRANLDPTTSTFSPSNDFSSYFGNDNSLTGGSLSRVESQPRIDSTARKHHPSREYSTSDYNSQAHSRNNSVPPSRNGEISPTDVSFAFSTGRQPAQQSFPSLLERPLSQHGRLTFGDMPTTTWDSARRPSAPNPLGQTTRSLGRDNSIDFHSERAGSMSSNGTSGQYPEAAGDAVQAHVLRQTQIRRPSQPSSSTDLVGLNQQLMTMSMQNGFPTLSQSEHNRDLWKGSSLRNTTDPGYVNQVRQDRGYGSIYGHHQQSQYNANRRYEAGPELNSINGNTMIPLNPQASCYTFYNNLPGYDQPQHLAHQQAMGQQLAYQQVHQNRFGQQPVINTRILPRGPSLRGSELSSSMAEIKVLKSGHGWVLKKRGNGQETIETSPDCRLRDAMGSIAIFCGDQAGSRFLQDKLETASSEEKEQIFRELLPNTTQLCTDPFGNYVIQKFFEHGVQWQKRALAEQMKGQIVNLSMHMYGCRCVQKAFEYVLVEQQAELVLELKDRLLEVSKDQQGNHVVQKAIERLPHEHIQFIINGFYGYVEDMSNNAFGCRVIQRLLEYNDPVAKARLIGEIHDCTQRLVRNPYGNYVVQHIIEHGTRADRDTVINLVLPMVVELMQNKYASNVIEKCLKLGTDEQCDALVSRIAVRESSTGRPRYLKDMMLSSFGNYVVQRILKTLPPGKWEDFAAMVDECMKQIDAEGKRDKKISEFCKLLSQGPYAGDAMIPLNDINNGNVNLHRARSSVHGSSTAEVGSPVHSTPPSLTRTQPSPQSSGAPSSSNSLVDGQVGESARSVKPGEAVVRAEETGMA